MKAKQRFDSVKFKARFDENGFLVDRPVVARIGLQVYETPFGKRREFRPAAEVFKSDSLQSFAGKPVTLGHVMVNPDNADSVVVGTCAGAAVPAGIGVEAPISIFVRRAIDSAIKKDTAELSVGYTSVDIERGGWGNNATGEYFFHEDTPEGWKADSSDWVEFDALQTDIKVNHIALVFKGRAGIAKLNLDSEQELPYDSGCEKNDEVITMTVKIKLDGSNEFEVVKEVADHISALSTQATELQSKLDSVSGERDTLKAKVDEIPELISKAEAKAKADAQEVVNLSAEAELLGIKCDGLDAKGIKLEIIKAASGVDASEKSDSYIDGMLEAIRSTDNMAEQRKSIKGDAMRENKEDGSSEVGKPDPMSRLKKLNK